MKKSRILINALLITIFLLSACSSTAAANPTGSSSASLSAEYPVGSVNSQDDPAPETSSAEPDYGVVFPQDSVNEITITISEDNWALMLEDMTDLYGEQGSGQRAGLAGKPGQGPGENQRPAALAGDGNLPPAQMPDRPGAGMMGGADDQNPVWVEAEISFNGNSWEHVGIRFKGNSSLKSTWGSGSFKLPFKLDFDQYEDEYPETENQRLYGFKQVSFSSGFKDDSLLREKIAADLFREAGVPSAQTAYYAVSIDYGEGPVYFGLYTAVEVIDDTLIETQFSDDSGNVYKPEGSGATFAAGSFTESSFDKETNQDEDDYSDILALFAALHDTTRLSDPESWREGLEAVFDVDTFLNWLAVNTVIQNWDTYGVMQHNYYLYNNPETGQLVWIPWDNNESFKSGGGMNDSLGLDLQGVNNNWPLVSYLRDDPVYFQKYQEYMETFLADVYILEDMADTYQYYHDLITPYVLDEGEEFTQIISNKAFERSVSDLVQHTRERIEMAESFSGRSITNHFCLRERLGRIPGKIHPNPTTLPALGGLILNRTGTTGHHLPGRNAC